MSKQIAAKKVTRETTATDGQSDKVFQYLKKAVAGGRWKPGEKIYTENELCSELGVSRISVRAAIHRLASLGILESRQGKGTFVCESAPFGNINSISPLMVFDRPDKASMFEFRKIIEVETAGLAAQRAGREHVKSMRVATERMRESTEAADIAHYDMEFHYHLAKATGNPAIIKVFEVMRELYVALMEDNVKTMGTYGAKHHQIIIDAIEIRDSQLARESMLLHLDDAIRKVLKAGRN